MNRLIILGAGGYGKVIEDLASSNNLFDKIYFLDDKSKGEDILNRCETYKYYINEETTFYPAFGNNEMRLYWVKKLKENNAKILTYIHDSSYISNKCEVKDGVIIMPNVIIQRDTIIKDGCIINSGAIIDHNCIIEEGVHVCLGAIIKADNHIPSYLKIDAGKVIENNIYK
ncbi:hypothetical protein P5E86_14800 [Clostridium perfringens]|nr:hypothetical protein [Clostridium perfringens]